jgi:hypothetical protein
MSFEVRQVECYHITVDGILGAASRMLAVIAKAGISMLAYKAEALSGGKTRFSIFAMRSRELHAALEAAGLESEGPFAGIFVAGDDEPGSLAEIYARLEKAGIAVRESSGIADINGGYGVVLYLDEGRRAAALEALKAGS